MQHCSAGGWSVLRSPSNSSFVLLQNSHPPAPAITVSFPPHSPSPPARTPAGAATTPLPARPAVPGRCGHLPEGASEPPASQRAAGVNHLQTRPPLFGAPRSAGGQLRCCSRNTAQGSEPTASRAPGLGCAQTAARRYLKAHHTRVSLSLDFPQEGTTPLEISTQRNAAALQQRDAQRATGHQEPALPPWRSEALHNGWRLAALHLLYIFGSAGVALPCPGGLGFRLRHSTMLAPSPYDRAPNYTYSSLDVQTAAGEASALTASKP